MQHLLTRSLDRVTTVLRDEALRLGRDTRCYIPTHSLLNYTQWQIVSPESRLRDLPSVHGAIAQVWTGTARTPNVNAGRHAERTFETAYLEYGIAQDLTRGTDRTLWFLHDPIEDHPGRTWEDYLANYHRTLVASLLHPGGQPVRGGALAAADLHREVSARGLRRTRRHPGRDRDVLSDHHELAA